MQGMYANGQSRVRVGDGYSQDFDMKVRVNHYANRDQYSVPCSLLLC